MRFSIPPMHLEFAIFGKQKPARSLFWLRRHIRGYPEDRRGFHLYLNSHQFPNSPDELLASVNSKQRYKFANFPNFPNSPNFPNFPNFLANFREFAAFFCDCSGFLDIWNRGWDFCVCIAQFQSISHEVLRAWNSTYPLNFFRIIQKFVATVAYLFNLIKNRNYEVSPHYPGRNKPELHVRKGQFLDGN